VISKGPAIQTHDLTMLYGSGRAAKLALDHLNLTIQPGEIFGYLGPNGAGKTTTIRLLLDLIRPVSGRASILGLDSRTDSVEIHKRIGFLPGELALWENLMGREVIQYVARIRGKLDMAYVQQLAGRLEFDMNVRVHSYSSGNRRKLGLILALMNKPGPVDAADLSATDARSQRGWTYGVSVFAHPERSAGHL
jgi:ABC-2 type transport system ATP-binding protein